MAGAGERDRSGVGADGRRAGGVMWKGRRGEVKARMIGRGRGRFVAVWRSMKRVGG